MGLPYVAPNLIPLLGSCFCGSVAGSSGTVVATIIVVVFAAVSVVSAVSAAAVAFTVVFVAAAIVPCPCCNIHCVCPYVCASWSFISIDDSSTPSP